MIDEQHGYPSLAAVDAEIKTLREKLAVLLYEEEKIMAQRLHLMNKLRICLEIMQHHMPEQKPCPEGKFPELSCAG